MKALPIRAAAKQLHRHAATIRKWIREGAPCIREGGVGRGNGTIVDLDAIQQWRAAQVAPGLTQQAHQQQLQHLAESLLRCYRNDQAAQTVGITDRQAAGLLLLVYERLAKDLTGQPVDLQTLPEQMKHLCAISVE